ncbi:MAG: hypothetical protein IJ934_07750 [Acetobacter sp.]|nr:hypothetical protein [Acetobacter sp.]
MDNILIKKEGDCFEELEKRNKECLSQLEKKIELPIYETKDSFLWFSRDHKVTGEEMNTFVGEIQKRFAERDENIRKFFSELCNVCSLFNAKDKEYLSGIVCSVEQAKEASNQAMKAQRETEKAIKILLSFQAELRSLKHLKEIDTLYEDLRELEKSTDEIKAFWMAIEKKVNLLEREKKWIFKREKSTAAQIHSIKSRVECVSNIVIKNDTSIKNLTKRLEENRSQVDEKMDIYEAKCQSIKMQCRIAIVIAGISLITLIVIAFVR